MAGANIPYHLRTKKYIERLLFCELLQKISLNIDLGSHLYVSMGGSFLSDHKVLESSINIENLLSIEKEGHVVPRQEFNKDSEKITCKQMDTAELVMNFSSILQDYDNAENVIVWLDHAKAKGRHTQITEFGNLLSQLKERDIIKISVNCSISTLAGYAMPGLPATAQQAAMFQSLRDDLGDLFPEDDLEPNKVTNEIMAECLTKAIKRKALETTETMGDSSVIPISKFRYNDGMHEMLTVTCIVLNDEEIEEFFENTSISDWHFYSEGWGNCHKIEVPDLSIKERMKLNDILAKKSEISEIQDELGFQLHKKKSASLEAIAGYVEHKDYLPYVVISKSMPLPDEVLNYLEACS